MNKIQVRCSFESQWIRFADMDPLFSYIILNVIPTTLLFVPSCNATGCRECNLATDARVS
jgi:hypothetical protein